MAGTDRRTLRQQRGSEAEHVVFRHLLRAGLRPIARNYRTRRGEIDLVMQDRDCLVFIEVRFRSGTSFVPARQTVDARKQRKLAAAALLFLAQHRRIGNPTCRFDVVGVARRDGDWTIDWLRDAFRPAG